MLGQHPPRRRHLLLGQAELVPDDVEDAGAAGVHRPAGDVLDAQPGTAQQFFDHPADVAGWAVHPGGRRILEVVADRLGLDDEQMAPSYDVLARRGNCSSATVLLVLEEMADVDGPVVVMAFGPGLTLYAALLLPA